MYRFNDTDTRVLTSEIKSADEALQKSLKASVPGLVHLQAADGTTSNQQSVLQGSMAGADDRYTATARHRSLIPPNPFNVSTLFQPTLSFIERATVIVPPGFEDETSAFGSVLEDFVVKVFLPQLDDKVTASFQQAVSGKPAPTRLDRRQRRRLRRVSAGSKYNGHREAPAQGKSSGSPITTILIKQSSVRVMSLIHSLCVMLETTPFHKENYSRLIIGVIVQYYQQCSARFRGESERLNITHQFPRARLIAASGQLARRSLTCPSCPVGSRRRNDPSPHRDAFSHGEKLATSIGFFAHRVAGRSSRSVQYRCIRNATGTKTAWNQSSHRDAARQLSAQTRGTRQSLRELGKFFFCA